MGLVTLTLTLTLTLALALTLTSVDPWDATLLLGSQHDQYAADAEALDILRGGVSLHDTFLRNTWLVTVRARARVRGGLGLGLGLGLALGLGSGLAN